MVFMSFQRSSVLERVNTFIRYNDYNGYIHIKRFIRFIRLKADNVLKKFKEVKHFLWSIYIIIQHIDIHENVEDVKRMLEILRTMGSTTSTLARSIDVPIVLLLTR